MNTRRTAICIVMMLFTLLGCSKPELTLVQGSAASTEKQATFVNRIWKVAESSSVAPGQLYAFLSEGTLVVASPHGKPTLGTWTNEGGVLTMVEEGISRKVNILELSKTEFRIRIHDPGGGTEIRLMPAEESSQVPEKPDYRAHAPPAADKAGVVSGSVAYRERMTLPPDAIVEVRLSDVSLQDVVAPVIAETTIAPAGRQVPIPFELRYDPSKIRPERTFAVRATIRSAGRMIFTTDTAYHVITRGNPTQVDLWLVRVGDEPSGATSVLRGTAWRLEDLGGAGVVDRVEATLEFPEAGKAVGSGSCNRFFGTVEITGKSIKFGPMGTTRMSCVEAVMNQETRYLRALQSAERFTRDGPALLIYSKEMGKPLRFMPKKP